MDLIESKIKELEYKIDYELKYGYESQQEKDIYSIFEQMLDLIKEIVKDEKTNGNE